MLSDDRDDAVVIRVKQVRGFKSKGDPSSKKYDVKFQIIGENEQKKVVNGKWKFGDKLEWDDYFYFNLKDLLKDYLVIFFYEEQDLVGYVEMPYKRIKKQFKLGNNTTTQNLIDRNGQYAGEIEMQIQRLVGQVVIGGIEPPKISLRPDAQFNISDEEDFDRVRLEKIHTQNLNFFSCMDAQGPEWEFMPQKFKGRGFQLLQQHYKL